MGSCSMTQVDWQQSYANSMAGTGAHLRKLFVLLRVVLYVSQDLDRYVLPTVRALVQRAKRTLQPHAEWPIDDIGTHKQF